MLIQILREINERLEEGHIKRTAIDFYRLATFIYYTKTGYFKIEESNGCIVLYIKEGIFWGSRVVYPSGKLSKHQIVTSLVDSIGYFDGVARKNYESVFDIGSFPGDFALLAHLIFPRAAIFAVDIDPYNAKYIMDFFYLNDVSGINVINVGIEDYRGKTSINPMGLESRISPKGVIVNVLTIDDLIDGKNPLIKMDIEGAEVKAVKGAEKTMSNGAEWLIACYHHVNG